MKTIAELTKESLVIRNSDPIRSNVYKMLVADTKKVAKEEHREAADEELIATAKRQVKETENAIALIKQGGGDTSKYESELVVLREFLPPALDETALRAMIDQLIGALAPEARNKKSMGGLMAQLREVPGADMKLASKILGEKLA